MVTIDFSFAIAMFFSLCFLLVFPIWLFYNFGREKNEQLLDLEMVIQCPYCTFFINVCEGEIVSCPNCKSLIDPQESGRNKGDC